MIWFQFIVKAPFFERCICQEDQMDRRKFVTGSALALAGLSIDRSVLPAARAVSSERPEQDQRINVAFVISPRANVIDLAGAWEVFQDVMIGEGDDHRMPYRLYTVSDRTDPIEATGGLKIVPDYRLADAPAPRVISVGAQRGSPEIHQWLRAQAGRVDVLMSVCTGAFQLGRAGVLNGRRATTHHDFWGTFEDEFPDVTLVRGRRYVADGNIITAGGLTSGIDAALHVVARMFGEQAAERTATYMEYDSQGWRRGERTSS